MPKDNTPKSPTLAQLQQQVDEWIHTYGVRYFSELTNMACLTEEVGELAHVMARKYGDQSFKIGETQAMQCSFEKKTKRDATRHINNPKLKV